MSSITRINAYGQDQSSQDMVEFLADNAQNISKLEILSLSVNQITTLKTFTNCTHLREIYLRRNLIRSEISLSLFIYLYHLSLSLFLSLHIIISILFVTCLSYEYHVLYIAIYLSSIISVNPQIFEFSGLLTTHAARC